MKRREFIAATAALLVSPRRSRAQGTRRRLGVLAIGADCRPSEALLDGLRNHGWIDGQNLIIEYRYAQSQDRLPALAAELVALSPDLLIAASPQAAVALKSATATIPIVFVAVADPVGIGLVQSLSRPGGNITGLATFVPGVHQQRDRNTTGNGSYRLENCGLGQSGQSNSQADNSRGAAPNGPETRRGSADSRGDHGRGTGHRLCLGRSPARRCNNCFWRSFDLSQRHASYRARGEASSTRDLSQPTYSSPMAD